MAMTLMKIVPQKTGTAPNAPVEAIWSARIGVCGLQLNPKRNSETCTWEKNLDDEREDDAERCEHGEDRADNQQPAKDAVDAVASPEIGRQARAREGNAGDGSREGAYHHGERGHVLQRPVARSGIDGDLIGRAENASRRDILDFAEHQRNAGRCCAFRQVRRQTRQQQPVDDRVLGRQPDQDEKKGRQSAPERDEVAVIGRDRMKTVTCGFQAGCIGAAEQVPGKGEGQNDREKQRDGHEFRPCR
jgi:hypothetical protein